MNMNTLNAHDQLIQDIVWDYYGNTYATSCKDKCLRIIDARSPQVAQVILLKAYAFFFLSSVHLLADNNTEAHCCPWLRAQTIRNSVGRHELRSKSRKVGRCRRQPRASSSVRLLLSFFVAQLMYFLLTPNFVDPMKLSPWRWPTKGPVPPRSHTWGPRRSWSAWDSRSRACGNSRSGTRETSRKRSRRWTSTRRQVRLRRAGGVEGFDLVGVVRSSLAAGSSAVGTTLLYFFVPGDPGLLRVNYGLLFRCSALPWLPSFDLSPAVLACSVNSHPWSRLSRRAAF